MKVKPLDNATNTLSNNVKISTQVRSSTGEIKGGNYRGKVGIRNKWGLINQLRAGNNTKGSCNVGDRQIDEKTSAIRNRIKRESPQTRGDSC